MFYTFLIIIRRFLVKRFLATPFLISKKEKIYNSDRDRFSDRSLHDNRVTYVQFCCGLYWLLTPGSCQMSKRSTPPLTASSLQPSPPSAISGFCSKVENLKYLMTTSFSLMLRLCSGPPYNNAISATWLSSLALWFTLLALRMW